MKRNRSLMLFKGSRAIFHHTESSTHVVNAVRSFLPSGIEVVFGIKYPKVATQTAKAAMLQDLIAAGLNQKNSATMLNMSQSYASKLLHK